MRKTSFIVGLLLVAWSFALSSAPQQPAVSVQDARNALVEIRVIGQGEASGGWEYARASGVIVEGGFILTCGHIFWRGDDPKDTLRLSRLIIELPSGRRFNLHDLVECDGVQNPLLDKERDIAVLKIDAEDLPAIALGLGEPVPLKTYMIVGRERTLSGELLGYTPEGELVLDIEAVPGMSGAPVIDPSTAELVGLIIAGAVSANKKVSVAVPASWVQELLGEFQCEVSPSSVK